MWLESHRGFVACAVLACRLVVFGGVMNSPSFPGVGRVVSRSSFLIVVAAF